MKKMFMALLLLAELLPRICALGPGEDAPALTIDKWYRGPEVTLQPPQSGATPEKIPFFRVVVIWGTWSPAATESLQVLNSLKAAYPERDIAAIARDSAESLDKQLARAGQPAFSIALDKEDKTSIAYMPGEMIFPKAFVVDADRQILWTGEVIDLPETVADIVKGTFRLSRAKKLHKYRSDLVMALQSGDEGRIIRASDDILQEEPGNLFALRARMFVYESSGRLGDAVRFINALLVKEPNQSRLYFMKLELLLREPVPDVAEFQRTAEAVSRQFRGNVTVLNSLAWFILDRTPFRMVPAALLQECTDSAVKQLPTTATAAEKGAVLGARARALFFVGRIGDAINIQQEAASVLPEHSDARKAAAAILNVMEEARNAGK